MKKKPASRTKNQPSVLVLAVFLLSLGAFFRFMLFDERFLFYSRLASVMTQAAWLFFITSCAFGAGEIILSPVKKNFHSKIEKFVFASAAGFGSISVFVFLMGAFNILHPFPAVLLITALFLFSLSRLRIFFKTAEKAIISKPGEVLDIYEISLIAIMGISAFMYFLQCFAPPLNYDSLAYHLAVPKIFIESGRIRFIPNNVYANFPMNMEFLFMLGMLIRDDSLARLLHFAAGVLSALAIYSFTAKHFTRKAGLTASAAFFNIPYVGLLSGWAYNELLLSLYILLSVFCFCEWAKKSKTENLALSAIFCGLAIGTKYTALLLILPFLCAGTFIKTLSDGENKKTIIKKMLFVIALTLAVPLPWFIKNAVYTYNPVYPFLHGFFNSIFPHPAAADFDTVRFVSQHTPAAVSAVKIINLFKDTLLNLRVGPFFAVFLPFLVLPGSFKKFESKILVVYFASYLLLWTFFTHQYPRFLIPAMGCLAIAVSGSVITLSERSRPLKGLIQTLLIAVLLSNLAWIPFHMTQLDMHKAIFGLVSRDKFLEESGLYQYPAFRFINEELPEEAKILFIGENQTYYVDREIVSNSPLDTNITVEVINASRSITEVREKLKEMGITHILFNASEVGRTAEYYDSFRWAGWREERLFARFISNEHYLKELFRDGGVIVWELE